MFICRILHKEKSKNYKWSFAQLFNFFPLYFLKSWTYKVYRMKPLSFGKKKKDFSFFHQLSILQLEYRRCLSSLIFHKDFEILSHVHEIHFLKEFFIQIFPSFKILVAHHKSFHWLKNLRFLLDLFVKSKE